MRMYLKPGGLSRTGELDGVMVETTANTEILFLVRIDPLKKDQFPDELLSLVLDQLQSRVPAKRHKFFGGMAAVISCSSRDRVIYVGMNELLSPLETSPFVGHIMCWESPRSWWLQWFTSSPIFTLSETTHLVVEVLRRDNRIVDPECVSKGDLSGKFSERVQRLQDRTQ